MTAIDLRPGAHAYLRQTAGIFNGGNPDGTSVPQPVEIVSIVGPGRVEIRNRWGATLIVPTDDLVATVAAARTTDPDTSHSPTRPSWSDDRTAALLALADAGDDGLTDFELAAITGVKQTSIGKRRGELRDRGLVADSGRRRESDTRSAAIVWTITPSGRDAATERRTNASAA